MRHSYRLFAAAAAASLLVAGCGSGGDNAGGNGSGGGSDKPVTIGVITSLSGQYSVLGGFVKNTLDLYAEQANAAGGIKGRKVKLEYADDQTNPTQAAIALRQLSSKNPTAIVGPVLSSSCVAILDKIEELRIPMVTTCATDSQVSPARKYTFMSALSTPAQVKQITDYLSSTGKKRIAVLHDTTDFGKSGFEQLRAQAGALDVVTDKSYELKSTTFVPQLSAAAGSGADAIVVWGAGPPLVTIAKEYRQLGSRIPLVFSAAGATPLFLGPAGDAASGITMASSLSNVVSAVPEGNRSKQVVTKLADDYQTKYGKPTSQFTADACGAWQVIRSAVEKAGADPQKVRDAIEDEQAVGCHGTYDYTPDNHRGLSAGDVWVVTVENGKLVPSDFSKKAAG